MHQALTPRSWRRKCRLRWWRPDTLWKTDSEGLVRELIAQFVEEEYLAFPARAHELDRGFSEAIGALAVVDAIEGDLQQATRNAERALRLDPACRTAALARALATTCTGESAHGSAMLDELLSRPLGENLPSVLELMQRQARSSPLPLPAPGESHE